MISGSAEFVADEFPGCLGESVRLPKECSSGLENSRVPVFPLPTFCSHAFANSTQMKASFLQKAKHFPQFTSMVPEAGRILTRAAQVQGLVRIDADFHFTAGAHAARRTSSGFRVAFVPPVYHSGFTLAKRRIKVLSTAGINMHQKD